jgi:hypothetical protein
MHFTFTWKLFYLLCCWIAVTAGGNVVEVATGVAIGVVPPLVVITFTYK